MTTIPVPIDPATHATLQQWADEQQATVAQIIAELVDKRFWAEARRAYQIQRDDPIAWQEYREESALLDGVLMDGLHDEPPYPDDRQIATDSG